MSRLINRQIKSFLGKRGIQVARSSASPDPFFVKRRLVNKEAPVIFDVGAYDGGTSAEYRLNFPRADIHAFEPARETYRKLADRHERDPNIHCVNSALAEVEGVSTFYLNQLDATNSLQPTSGRAGEIWGKGRFGASALHTVGAEMVPVDTLDNYCKKNRVDEIDILKIDVQGAELKVLLGGAGLFAGEAIKLVYIEVITAATYEDQSTPGQLFTFFESIDYRMLNIYNVSHRNHDQIVQFDALFISPDTNTEQI